MKTVGIIGFGRFGQTLYRLLKDDFSLVLFDKSALAFTGVALNKETRVVGSPEEVYQQAETIFLCVPIESFESIVRLHKKCFREQHLLIDVLSVKMYAEKVLRKYLRGTKTQAILTHPMFGPDSSKNGFVDLPVVMDQFLASPANYRFWKDYFLKKELRVVEMAAKEHDKLAANSQGLTHFVGRLLEEYDFASTEIDTLGAKKLLEVKDQTCNDTWQLFLNLQNYNPYTKSMRLKLGRSYDRLFDRLLPTRVNSKCIIYGIQGGAGSFNEQTILHYIESNKIKDYKIKYLYTSEKVLKNVHEGNIDFGLFAIHNSVGGIVDESVAAMARYKFSIIEEISIPIKHYLMKRKDIPTHKINAIMAHPQVFRQCQSTLKEKYSYLKLLSGVGDLIDTAKAAQALAKGTVPKTTAILGPRRLSELYDLEIIAKNLQDDKTNNTSFLLVQR